MFEWMHKPSNEKKKQEEPKPLPMCVGCDRRIMTYPYKQLFFEIEDGQVITLHTHNTVECYKLSQIKRKYLHYNYLATGMVFSINDLKTKQKSQKKN